MIDFNKIKVIIIDVDGTLTDGMYIMSSTGERSKQFYTRDFYGIELLLKHGLTVMILTQSGDTVIGSQVERLTKVSSFWSNKYKERKFILNTACEDKEKEIKKYLDNEGLTWYNVAYMGDAENDVSSMEKVQIAACPSDAIEEVKEISNFISSYKGGYGAVCEFCKYMIEKRDKNENS